MFNDANDAKISQDDRLSYMKKLYELGSYITKLRKERRNVIKELSRAPKGELEIIRIRNNIYFRHSYIENGRRVQKGISRDRALVAVLAHKR